MEGWEAIRGLDEVENWAERNRVLSKKDHIQLVESAREIVNDLVQNLPVSSPSKPDSTSYGFTDDDFKYSSAQFDVDYLEGISSEASADPSALSRKSLFVKFDPLLGTSPTRDRVPLGDSTHLSNIAATDGGDLLMLTTPPPHSAPPPHSINHVDTPTQSSDAGPLVNHHAAAATATLIDCSSSPRSSITGTTSQLNSSSPPISSPPNISSATHQSGHAHDHTPFTTRSPGPGISTSSHTSPRSDSAPDQTPSSPLTDNLVEVLKYSEHNLPEILEEARKQQRDMETAKHETEVRDLKERIDRARKQALQQHKRKGHLQSKTVHVLAAINSTEEQINTLREQVTHHTEKEKELCKKHEEFRKQFGELDEQFELVSKDSASLENSFDELHKHYLRLKVIHHKLTEGSKILNQHLAELRTWDSEDTDYSASLQQELQEMETRAEERFSGLRENQEAMLTVEKSRTQVLKVKHENLQETYKIKVVDRDEAAKICGELMKMHEKKTSQNIHGT